MICRFVKSRPLFKTNSKALFMFDIHIVKYYSSNLLIQCNKIYRGYAFTEVRNLQHYPPPPGKTGELFEYFRFLTSPRSRQYKFVRQGEDVSGAELLLTWPMRVTYQTWSFELAHYKYSKEYPLLDNSRSRWLVSKLSRKPAYWHRLCRSLRLSARVKSADFPCRFTCRLTCMGCSNQHISESTTHPDITRTKTARKFSPQKDSVAVYPIFSKRQVLGSRNPKKRVRTYFRKKKKRFAHSMKMQCTLWNKLLFPVTQMGS